MYNYLFAPEAEREYLDSIEWYSVRSLSTASKFIDEVEKSIDKICLSPHRYRKTDDDFREFSIDDYPFAIIYDIDETNRIITISAIYHHKRNPKNKYRKK